VDVYGARLLLAPATLSSVAYSPLVGANLALTYLSVAQPKACGIDTGAGARRRPLTLSGTACCRPVVLIAVGVTATSGLRALFAWLVPDQRLALAGEPRVRRRQDRGLTGRVASVTPAGRRPGRHALMS